VNQRLLYLIKAILISVVLFALWSWISSIYVALLSSVSSYFREIFGASSVTIKKDTFSFFIIPALSLILASSDNLSRKLKYLGVSVAILFLYQVFSIATGIAGLASMGFYAGLAGSAASIIDNFFARIYPILVVLLFFNAKINSFLNRNTAQQEIKRCPICGQAKAGLADHIKAVHGEKSLSKPSVRRVLDKA